MTEALQMMLRTAFRQLRLHRVEANILPDIGRRSRAGGSAPAFAARATYPCYLKIGGRWRDHERWALLADDWRPPAIAPAH